jgi:hypothetical protein
MCSIKNTYTPIKKNSYTKASPKHSPVAISSHKPHQAVLS